MNLTGKMKKLQMAIVKSGLPVKVNTQQFHSVDQNRMINSYRVTIPVSSRTKDGEWKEKEYEVIKTCSMPEVIFCLADIWKAVREWQGEQITKA